MQVVALATILASGAAATSSRSPAVLHTPAEGATLDSATPLFLWYATGTAAPVYQLHVGSSPGAHDYGYWETSGNWVYVPGLPGDGRLLYVTLWTALDEGGWVSSSSTVHAFTEVAATLSFPAVGSALTGPVQQFAWTNVNADRYQLHIGNTPGAHDVTYADALDASVVIAGLPTDGRTLYATLWSAFGDRWVASPPVTYLAAQWIEAPAVITTPVAGTAAGPSGLEVFWTDVHADRYQVHIGSMPGAYDLGFVDTTSAHAQLTGLPVDGSTFYATVYAAFGGEWLASAPVPFRAFLGGQPARLTYPLDGSTFDGSSQFFVWNDAGATLYQLHLGTAPGQYDIGYWSTTATNVFVDGLPLDGSIVYATLWSLQPDGWVSSMFSFSSNR